MPCSSSSHYSCQKPLLPSLIIVWISCLLSGTWISPFSGLTSSTQCKAIILVEKIKRIMMCTAAPVLPDVSLDASVYICTLSLYATAERFDKILLTQQSFMIPSWLLGKGNNQDGIVRRITVLPQGLLSIPWSCASFCPFHLTVELFVTILPAFFKYLFCLIRPHMPLQIYPKSMRSFQSSKV